MQASPSVNSAASGIDTDVLIVGAGPTGLTLATALATRGVRTLLVDRQAAGANTSRAAVVHARTLEVLEPLGVTDTLVSRGIPAKRFTIRDRDRVLVPIGFEDLPTAYPYTLMISQATTEGILLERLLGLGGQVLRPRTLIGLKQDDAKATALLDDGSWVTARFIVGADGMHSAVREQAGIPFTGGSYGETFVLADVRLSGAVPSDEVILYFSAAGMVVVAPLADGVHRIVATVAEAPDKADAAFLQALLDTRGPEREPAVVHEVLWSSRFRVHHRIADTYCAGRVLLAGDAAHVHSPAGGQGMNAGILDAVTLADALVAALAGNMGALDAYSAQRRPVAVQIVAFTDRLTRMAAARPGLRRLRNLLLSTVSRPSAVRRRLAWQLSGLVYRPSELSAGGRHGAVARSGSALWKSITGALQRFMERRARARQNRDDARILWQLDDDQLKDIGLTRGEIGLLIDGEAGPPPKRGAMPAVLPDRWASSNAGVRRDGRPLRHRGRLRGRRQRLQHGDGPAARGLPEQLRRAHARCRPWLREQSFSHGHRPARVTIDAIEWRADTGTDITEEERRALLGHLRGALLERVHTLPRAQTGHPAVLRAAITRVETVSPSLNAVSALLLFAPLDRGGAAVEIEALAPDTGQQLAALSLGYFTPLSDMKVRFSRLAPAQLALRKAAADFSELLQPAAGTKPTARD
ncbi:Pentachlorophenol 4-monooxygenase [Methylibium sp. T29-B]|nr:Pentachlorophenol 4-monooxygenase [Methylibium sp. T29-B]